jgi:peptidoglycan/LPS O-acetylase OafA/YrhL
LTSALDAATGAPVAGPGVEATRLPGLDAARALAVGLVIAVHALLPFTQTPIGWAIRDRPRHELVDLAVWVTRAFVMPVFFWLSGFLAHGALERRGLADFVRQRIARVGLPLLLLVWPNSVALGALWDAGRALQPRPGVAAQLPQLRGTGLAVSLGHLWFLYYLLLVSSGAVALVLASRAAKRALAGPGLPPAFLAGREPRRAPSLVGPLALALPLSALLLSAGKLQLDTPLSFAVDPFIALFFGLFFAWGWRAQARPNRLAAYGRRAWVCVAVALTLLAVIVPSLRESAAAAGAPAGAATAGGPPLAALAASAAFSTLTTAAFIGLCQRYVTRRHRSVELLARASYFCYVVHLPLLVALQIVLAGRAWPATLKYGAALGCTLGTCLVSHAAFSAISDRLAARWRRRP